MYGLSPMLLQAINWFEQFKGNICDQTPHDCLQHPFSGIAWNVVLIIFFVQKNLQLIINNTHFIP